MTKKNEELMQVLHKDVAVIPCNDGWLFKFDAETLQNLLDVAVDSGEDAAFVFVKVPEGN